MQQGWLYRHVAWESVCKELARAPSEPGGSDACRSAAGEGGVSGTLGPPHTIFAQHGGRLATGRGGSQG